MNVISQRMEIEKNNEKTSDNSNIENVNINDILEVYADNLQTISSFDFLTPGQARVLQIKIDANDRFYYVHFLNFEKRMDRWISDKEIKINLGNKDRHMEGVIFEFDSRCRFVLIRR